jgi:hypothetical protein
MDKLSASLPKITFQRKRHLQLVKLGGDLAEQTREEADALGFMSRLLIMVNLPYRDPGKECKNWWRQNGNVTINVSTGYYKQTPIGIPYGAYPRLILAYLITQAVKTQEPTIYLGKSFSHFLGLIGIRRGGRQYRQLHKQLKRTLSAAFAWTYSTDKQWSRANIQISSQSQLWWDEKLPDQESLWESYIRLNMDFYNEIMRNAVPLDLRVLATLKNSPLALDLYMFITWRVFRLSNSIAISWESLQQQLGGQYADLKVFARDCRKHIKDIQALNPHFRIDFIKGRLCLKPSRIF